MPSLDVIAVLMQRWFKIARQSLAISSIKVGLFVMYYSSSVCPETALMILEPYLHSAVHCYAYM